MKVAILGTAPTVGGAPFDDPEWKIWGTRACQDLPRWDRCFEIHGTENFQGQPEYYSWLKAQEKPIVMQRHYDEIPASEPYPLEAAKAKFGTWFFSSSMSYMMAQALMMGVQDIGLWGVDMAHATEYEHQKPGCRFFIQMARLLGVRVHIPEISEVIVPGRLYGFESGRSWLYGKATARRAELSGRIGDIVTRRSTLALEYAALRGKRDLTVSADHIAKRLPEIEAETIELERNELILGGALQDQDHVLNNWA